MNDLSETPRPQFLTNPAKMHFIGGKWQPSLSGETIETFNPATGRVLVTRNLGLTVAQSTDLRTKMRDAGAGPQRRR